MIDVIMCGAEEATAEVVSKAFERSFTRGQVRCGNRAPLPDSKIVVALSPTDADVDWLKTFARRGGKILLFGSLGPYAARFAGIAPQTVIENLVVDCPPAPKHGTSESSGALVYVSQGVGGASPLQRRPFCRFDFTSEWNNLGFGRIDFGAGPWSIGVTARSAGAKLVAEVMTADGKNHGAAVTLYDLPRAAILWFARPAGPIDGADWRVVEAFIADHRDGDLPCRPYLRDVPHGIAAAVTMRLDCDEGIASARNLFEFYRRRGIPLSAAIKTGQASDQTDVDLLRELFADGGAILSHSVSHPANWGGSATAAEAEAVGSKCWLEQCVPGLSVRYAVSPFHHCPTFAPTVLARAGYRGVVAGTIAGDPAYLMARGGIVPFGPRGFVSHSQSCMLHGDCLLPDGDPIAVYKEAFRIARAAGQFFGYLDHPFSQRYSYGWSDEAERQRVHGDFLDFLDEECASADAPLLFVSEAVCLDFMLEKAECRIEYDEARGVFSLSRTRAAGLPISLGFRGRTEEARCLSA
jgi:hypothetical protein